VPGSVANDDRGCPAPLYEQAKQIQKLRGIWGLGEFGWCPYCRAPQGKPQPQTLPKRPTWVHIPVTGTVIYFDQGGGDEDAADTPGGSRRIAAELAAPPAEAILEDQEEAAEGGGED
jgi:hypothetical protein